MFPPFTEEEGDYNLREIENIALLDIFGRVKAHVTVRICFQGGTQTHTHTIEQKQVERKVRISLWGAEQQW
jgi:hypothetical protein